MDLGGSFDRRRFLHVVAGGLTVRALAPPGAFAASGKYEAMALYRDARLWTIGGGTSEIMKEIIAKRLGL